ncbi:MAG: CotH kinase family protein [Flavobacteriales bacterium]|nr:CotH kinase family protein [Flavobacteriales bacterium]
MKKNYFLAIILFIATSVISQEYNPDFGDEYIQDYLPTINVTMAEEDYNWMVHPDNIWSSDYQHATVTYKGSNGLVIDYSDLGIRLRGNTSRSKNKKSFKLHFEKFTDDQYFFGLKKVNLKAETNDPSAIREHLVMNLYRENNIPVARINHIKFYINSNYMGLYSSVEQIDSRFVTSRFNNKSGNLYKCTYGSSNGADLANVNEVYNDDIYELKTNEDVNNRSQLEAFITFLTTSTDTDFENKISEYINIDSYIKQLAIEILSGHWDGYSYNKNNFYLYYNPDKLWFEYIPYDTDNTLGIDWVSRDWSTRNIYDWARHGNSGRPLTSRLMNSEKYVVKYSKAIDDLLKTKFNTTYQMNIAYNYKNLIDDAIYSDTYYPQDFGYTNQIFDNSYTINNVANHAKYGIEPFIDKRYKYAQSQLDQSHLAVDEYGFYNSIKIYPIPSKGSVTIEYSTSVKNNVTLEIFDLQGRVIKTEYFENQKRGDHTLLWNIDSSIKKGSYIIRISTPVEILSRMINIS